MRNLRLSLIVLSLSGSLVLAACGEDPATGPAYAYTVAFNSPGATVAASPATMRVVDPATTVGALPTAPTRTGFAFLGWTNAAGAAFTAATPVTADVTVYAKWAAGYTVTFDSQGATTAAEPGWLPVADPATTTGVLPAAPVKTGCDFAGWYTAPHGGGAPFTDLTPVTADITVYAAWSTTGLAYTLINGDAEYGVSKGTAVVGGQVFIPGHWAGKHVTALEVNAFENCGAMTSIALSPETVVVGNRAFFGCAALKNMPLPTGVKNIGVTAFYGCSGLTNISIPPGVTNMGALAFYLCSGLTSLTIPTSITTLEMNVFESCQALQSLTIPENVTTIGIFAFKHCLALKNLYMERAVAPAFSLFGEGTYDNTFMAVTNCTLHLKAGATGYGGAPWTTAAIFSSVVYDMP